MEPISAIASCLTIAALFKVCVEAFDLIQASHRQQREYELQSVELEIERARLYFWGQSMGLLDDVSNSNIGALDQLYTRPLIRLTLEMLKSLVMDAEILQHRYGGQQTESPAESASTPTSQITKLFDNLSVIESGSRTPPKFKNRVRWVIRDEEKFRALLADIKGLIGGLQELTNILMSVHDQRSKMSAKLETINDVETLDLISSACATNHPDISEMATKLSERRTIAWVESSADATPQGPEKPLSRAVQSLEDMTVTELKHQILITRETERWLSIYFRQVVKSVICLKTTDGEEEWVIHRIRVQFALQDTTEIYHWKNRELPVVAISQLILAMCCEDCEHSCSFEGPRTCRLGNHTVSDHDEILHLLKPGRCVRILSLIHPPRDWISRQSYPYLDLFSDFESKPQKTSCQTPNQSESWSVYVLPIANYGGEGQGFLESVFSRLGLPELLSEMKLGQTASLPRTELFSHTHDFARPIP